MSNIQRITRRLTTPVHPMPFPVPDLFWIAGPVFSAPGLGLQCWLATGSPSIGTPTLAVA